MSKSLLIFGMVVGSTIGGYIPSIFGAGLFSFFSIFCSAIGGFLGIWIAYRLMR